MSGDLYCFTSRRPAVILPRAAVVCAQPLAAKAGLDVLEAGGNAADAAVAMAAALGVTQPCSTGIGGDAFCVYYDAATRQVRGLNGSGRAPGKLTLERIHEDGFDVEHSIPLNHGHTVTVPGAAAAWVDTVEKYGSGKLTLGQIMQPSIDLAENGFPVSQTAAIFWGKGSHLLKHATNEYGSDMLLEGQAPKWGAMFHNRKLADVYRRLASEGKSGFYEGTVGQSVVDAVRASGGVMSLEDLSSHVTSYEEPISVEYKGVRLWEIPPNGQGIVALMALNILRHHNVQGLGHNSADYLHLVIESIRLAFADAMAYVADSSVTDVPVSGMLSEEYGRVRSSLIDPHRAMKEVPVAHMWDYDSGKDTVYLTVVDQDGNACSFINSNYMGFGTGIVPRDCGFTLQNRGANFSLDPDHPNVIAPGKRPYHTIIPAMLTDDKTGELLASYGVMGGFMQPQGHVQVLFNMLEFGMDPQRALDAPRFLVGPGHAGPVGAISLEDGIHEEVVEDLRNRGHDVVAPVCGVDRAAFGRGHVITAGAWWRASGDETVASKGRTLWAGSDPRADGYPMGY